MKVTELKNGAMRLVNRAGLKVKKHSPEILLAMGIVSFIATVITASKATLKIDEVLAEDSEKLDSCKKAHAANAYKSEEDYNQDVIILYSRMGLSLAKLYAVPTALGLASIGCFVSAHVIMDKRNAALTGSLIAVQSAFNKYRERVIEAEGKELDEKCLHGYTKETIEKDEIDESGKTHKVKELVNKSDAPELSPYARIFDESSVYWQKAPEYNQIFLKRQQAAANDMLKIRGHVFLNEVYDMIGIPRSQLGAVVGWVYNSEKGDNFIDFGLTDITREKVRDFINGYERSILLDFNVDGIIYDLI